MLTSLVIEDLSTRFPVSQDTGVAFAYASYKDIDSSQNPKTFISSFILQLSRQREGLMPELDAFYSANRKDARDPTFTTLRGLLLSILVHFNTVYIVFDALDEVEQRAELLKFLTELVPKNNKAEVGKCAVKLFVTSRKERDIESRFCEASSIRIRATKVSADIDAYIQDELDRRIKNQQLHIQGIDNLKDKILQTLSRRADGM